MGVFEETGRFFLDLVRAAGQGMILFWKTLREFRHVLRERHKTRRQAFLSGVCAIPVVTITAMFSGMVIAAQTGFELC